MSLDNDTVETVQDELTALKARADLLGVTYHPNIKADKLREKVNAALAGEAAKEDADTPVPAEETIGQKRSRMKKEALKLIRIRLTCMNPAKTEWSGEVFTVGNSLLGSVKRYVPFNAQDNGWHVEAILLQMLQDRKCQVFQTKRDDKGNSSRTGRLIPEFAIEILPPLTDKERTELARKQALANGTADD